MRAKELAAALAVLVTVYSTSWADGAPDAGGDRIFSGSQTLALNLNFYTLVPCRAVDTRAGMPLTSDTTRIFQIAGVCDVPATAKALALNVAVVGPTATGYVKLWSANLPEPVMSTISFGAAMTRTNNAVVTLATNGSGELSAKALLADSGSVHLVIDVTGYMAGDPLAQCQCPIDGIPLSMIFGVNPSSGSVGSTVSVFGQNLPPNVQVLFGDATTGSPAQIFSSSSTAITARVPAPPLSFTFATNPCDSDGDGIPDGTRNIPTPISVNAQSLDDTGCVATLVNAFTLNPINTDCTSDSGNAADSGSVDRISEVVPDSGTGDSGTQCLCPTNGIPLPLILGVNPTQGSVGSTVTISGQNFPPLVRVLFGDATTGSLALSLSSSSTSITGRVPTPPPGFTFATEPCDGNGDGIPGGTRYVPTPITVNVRSLDGTACVATLSNAFMLTPPQTTCTGDHTTPPPA